MSQSKSIALVIFVKTPGFSPLKTRLSAKIGQAMAEAFYLESLNRTEKLASSVMSKVKKAQAYWAVAESEALDHPLWESFPKVEQGQGGLGERLNKVYQELKKNNEIVLFMGADSPHLPLMTILESINALENGVAKHTMGPTEDGGFYLFGSRKEIPDSVWLETPYSSDQTAKVLCQKINSLGDSSEEEVFYHEILFDIDTVNELKRLSEFDNSYKRFLC